MSDQSLTLTVSSQTTNINVVITQATAQQLTMLEPFYVILNKGDKGDDGDPFVMAVGDKSSATDAGTVKDVSLGDDYLYICTTTGTAGNAIWKKTPLFKAL